MDEKTIEQIKIYNKIELDKEIKHYIQLQREIYMDDIRGIIDSVITTGEKVDKMDIRLESVEMRLGKVENRLEKIDNRLDSHDQMLHRHSKEIQLLKVA
jgi:hypothetical protein